MSAMSDHRALFKFKTAFESQEMRRAKLLEEQKLQRETILDVRRNIPYLLEVVDNIDNKKCNYRRKRQPSYKLMKAEWLIEMPHDFDENWLTKLCYEGTRYLLAANRGRTKCYLHNVDRGRYFTVKSNFPGGNSEHYQRTTIIDCVYNVKTNTFFVFDVLMWNSLALVDCQAEMRFQFLKSKFYEDSQVPNNKYSLQQREEFSFKLVDSLSTKRDILQDHLFPDDSSITDDNIKPTPIEGILFYHREGSYTFGITPLVCWLRSFMITEKLSIDVHPFHLRNVPNDYDNMMQYINRKKMMKICPKMIVDPASRENSEIEDEDECNTSNCIPDTAG